MKIKAYWVNDEKFWKVFRVWGIYKKKYEYLGLVDCPKGAHINTIVDEYKKKYRELEGELKW